MSLQLGSKYKEQHSFCFLFPHCFFSSNNPSLPDVLTVTRRRVQRAVRHDQTTPVCERRSSAETSKWFKQRSVLDVKLKKKKKEDPRGEVRFLAGAAWVGGRQQNSAALLTPLPALECLDKTPRTCRGISVRHHTWRKRQLNPAPRTTGPGSTKSSRHLEWI